MRYTKTVNPFYRSKAWRAVRLEVLRRDDYLCKPCEGAGRHNLADVVHHIQHLEHRPDLALVKSNLISVCHTCHNRLHPERTSERKKVANNVGKRIRIVTSHKNPVVI